MTRKKIIIIGNGFDRNLGLPTSYENFCESDFFKELLEKGNEIALYLKQKAAKRKQSNLSNDRNWGDIEVELKNFADKNYQTAKISDYNELVATFSKYLKWAISAKEIKQNTLAYQFLIKNAVDSGEIANVSIYNFNYTDTVRNILINCGWQESDLEKRLNYVHNNLNSEIVFGIQEDAQVTDYHSGVKKTGQRQFRPCSLINDLNTKNNIAVFGCSFGPSDNMYFQRFFTLLSAELPHNPKSSFELYYHGDGAWKNFVSRVGQLGGGMHDLHQMFDIDGIDTKNPTT